MRLFILLFLSTFSFSLMAQFQVGWRTDAYAGINSAIANPALPARTDYAWDINLAEGTGFLANNYGYFSNTSVLELFRLRNAEPAFVHERDLSAGETPNDNTLVYEFYTEDEHFMETMVTAMGPSFSVRVSPLARVGLFTRFQMMGMATHVDQDVGYDSWIRIADDLDFDMERMRLMSAAWAEVGLNYSQGIETNLGILTLGLNVRRLWGERGAYAINNDRFTISKVTDYIGLRGADFDIDAAFSNNVLETEVNTDPSGKGWGFDLGFLYQIEEGDNFFRWEIGAALLNVGRINFDGQLHNYNASEIQEVITADYEDYELDDGADALVQQFSEDIFGNALGSLRGDNFTIGLPTTLSLNTSYRFNEYIRIEANWLTSLASFGPQLTNNSVLSLTPRVDRYWWGVGMPVSWYNGNQLRLGLAARLGPV
ncbi:MAG: DUF5723 family protein, partial [Bacteroidota bacterium]